MNNPDTIAELQKLVESNLFEAKVAMDGVHTCLNDMSIDPGSEYGRDKARRVRLADAIQRQIGLLEQIAVDLDWHGGRGDGD